MERITTINEKEITMEKRFKKVLNSWDVLVVAFGAMIGWGWVVSSGQWIQQGGVLGTAIGFIIGGIMIYFVGLCYAELTTAMPLCGGEHVFSYKAFGPIGSFICTWSIILSYIGVVCYEAVSFSTILQYLFPGFLRGYLYSIEGFDIYLSWILCAIGTAVFITVINIIGTKKAAILQTIFTFTIAIVGIILLAGSLYNGDSENLKGQMFVGNSNGDMFQNILRVAIMTPFFFFGFDVIPQAAEEIKVPMKKIGRLMMLSIVLAVLFYLIVVISVGFVMNNSAIEKSMSDSGLVVADAMAMAFNSTIMSKVLIIGGLCGIITSWNSFLIGGSRALYSMAEAYMIPHFFSKLSKKSKSPVYALLLVGGLSVIAPFFGRVMLTWIVNASNFACCLAYCMVSVSFLVIRKKEPDMQRPYKIKHHNICGIFAIIMSGCMGAMYIIPGTVCTLIWQEWIIVGGWIILGVMFCISSKIRYKEIYAIPIKEVIENK